MSKSDDVVILSANQAIYKYSIETPEAIALQDKNNIFSYSDLAIAIQKFSKLLSQLGIKEGMQVSLSSSNFSMCLILILSLEKIGAVRVPLHSKSEVTLSDNPNDFFSKKSLNIIINQELINKALKRRINNNDYQNLNKAVLDKTRLFMSSTSGTTGNKKYFYEDFKGVKEWIVFFQSNYFSHPSIINNLSMYSPALGFSYVASLFSFNRGGRTFFTDTETIIKHNTIHSSSFSTMTLRDIEHCFLNNLLLQTKINTIRVIGAELAIHHRKYIRANISNKVINSYSSNEFGQVGEVGDDGFCYVSPKVNIKIVDENFNSLPFGEHGRIAVQSSQVINQYIDNKLNKNHFKDGFFISNDYGFLQSPSKLKVLGRVDHLLNIGSIKFASEPLEKEIEKNTDIKSCVVLADNIIFGIGVVIICIEQAEKLSFAEEINLKVIDYFYGLNIQTKVLEFEKFERTDTGKIIREKIMDVIINKKLIKEIIHQ